MVGRGNKVMVIGWAVCQQKLTATSEPLLISAYSCWTSGGLPADLSVDSFLLWAPGRQVTLVNTSLRPVTPDGRRFPSSQVQSQDVAAAVHRRAGFHPLSLVYWAVTWPVDLGNPWAGQREIVSSSSFKYLGLSLPLVFQGNLLQGLSSSGCLIMREQPMPCVLGWESLAATLNLWVLGWSLARVHVCVHVCVCVCVCVHGNTWLGCSNVYLLGLHFILLLVFCGHTFKIVTIAFKLKFNGHKTFY